MCVPLGMCGGQRINFWELISPHDVGSRNRTQMVKQLIGPLLESLKVVDSKIHLVLKNF